MNSEVNIKTISACLAVKDIERSKAWYGTILGFEAFYQKDYGVAKVAYLRKNNIFLELVENKEFISDKRPDPPVDHSQKQGVTHLTFSIEDNLDVIEKKLRKQNIVISFPITTAPDIGIRVMFIRDIDGNLVELNQTLNFNKSNDLLLNAIKEENFQEVTRLLGQKTDPDVRDTQTGLSALMLASGLGNSEIVKELIRAGANVFDTDSKAGSTALHKACQVGSLEVVRLLIEAGAFVDAVATSTGHTPLIEALWFKWPDVVAYLLEKGASLNVKTHYGFSLLDHFQYALKVNVYGKEKLLKADELLKRRQQDDNDMINAQKLMAAVLQNDLNSVKQFIVNGANIEERYPSLGGFNDFHTPLLVACRQGFTAIAAELIKAGADINAVEPTFGAVPLHKATYNGWVDVTKLLVEQSGINIDFQGLTNGYTPLHDALWHGFADCAEILINAGANLNLKGHDGKYPVDIAIEVFGKEHPIVKLLIELKNNKI
jgi:uncharacterized protein